MKTHWQRHNPIEGEIREPYNFDRIRSMPYFQAFKYFFQDLLWQDIEAFQDNPRDLIRFIADILLQGNGIYAGYDVKVIPESGLFEIGEGIAVINGDGVINLSPIQVQIPSITPFLVTLFLVSRWENQTMGDRDFIDELHEKPLTAQQSVFTNKIIKPYVHLEIKPITDDNPVPHNNYHNTIRLCWYRTDTKELVMDSNNSLIVLKKHQNIYDHAEQSVEIPYLADRVSGGYADGSDIDLKTMSDWLKELAGTLSSPLARIGHIISDKKDETWITTPSDYGKGYNLYDIAKKLFYGMYIDSTMYSLPYCDVKMPKYSIIPPFIDKLGRITLNPEMVKNKTQCSQVAGTWGKVIPITPQGGKISVDNIQKYHKSSAEMYSISTIVSSRLPFLENSDVKGWMLIPNLDDLDFSYPLKEVISKKIMDYYEYTFFIEPDIIANLHLLSEGKEFFGVNPKRTQASFGTRQYFILNEDWGWKLNFESITQNENGDKIISSRFEPNQVNIMANCCDITIPGSIQSEDHVAIVTDIIREKNINSIFKEDIKICSFAVIDHSGQRTEINGATNYLALGVK